MTVRPVTPTATVSPVMLQTIESSIFLINVANPRKGTMTTTGSKQLVVWITV